MPMLPVVVYVQNKNGPFNQGNPAREALVYHLKTACECEVWDYDHESWFLEDLTRIRYAINEGRLLTVIVKEEEYNQNQHLIVIAKIRELSATVPIVVMPDDWDGAKGITGYRRIYQHHEISRRLPSLIRRWREKLQLPLDHFGTENPSDLRRLTRQLQHAYQTQYLDGNELGTPDHNGQVVAQALRLRLCPAEVLVQEFDKTLRREVAALNDPGGAVYEQELQAVRRFCRGQQDDFWFLLMGSQGDTTGGSQGDMVEGFAIDPLTLQYCRTSGWGCHKSARLNLKLRLNWIADLESKRARSCRQEKKVEERIVSGLFFLQVEGFTLPIVRFDDGVDGENGKRIARFLKKQRLALPVLLGDEGELSVLEC